MWSEPPHSSFDERELVSLGEFTADTNLQACGCIQRSITSSGAAADDDNIELIATLRLHLVLVHGTPHLGTRAVERSPRLRPPHFSA